MGGLPSGEPFGVPILAGMRELSGTATNLMLVHEALLVDSNCRVRYYMYH